MPLFHIRQRKPKNRNNGVGLGTRLGWRLTMMLGLESRGVEVDYDVRFGEQRGGG